MNTNDATRLRYSDDELAEFRTLIEKKLARAQDDLDFYRDSLAALADSPEAKVKGLDDGTSAAETERLNTLAGRQLKLMQHLRNALQRIEGRVYGVCRQTGELIPKARLRAVPHATLSVEAKLARR